MAHRAGRGAVAALALALFLAACPEEGDEQGEAPAPALDEGQVLEAARALSHGLLQSVVAVRSRLDDADARRLADDLLDEARAARERARTLGERLDLELAPTPLSQELERAGRERLRRWVDVAATRRPLTAEWLEDQAAAQRAALDTLDAHLLPSAREAEVRELLRDMRRLAQEHHARVEAERGRRVPPQSTPGVGLR